MKKIIRQEYPWFLAHATWFWIVPLAANLFEPSDQTGLLLLLLMIGIPLYFSRTITLDEEGCCYSIWGFRRKLKWEDLTVQYCENRSPLFGLCAISPIYGPGILINVKGRTYNEIWTTDAYCLLFHPMTSVFLLFLPPMHEKWGSLRYLGYTVDKEELLAALKSFGQCLEVPEIQYRR